MVVNDVKDVSLCDVSNPQAHMFSVKYERVFSRYKPVMIAKQLWNNIFKRDISPHIFIIIQFHLMKTIFFINM